MKKTDIFRKGAWLLPALAFCLTATAQNDFVEGLIYIKIKDDRPEDMLVMTGKRLEDDYPVPQELLTDFQVERIEKAFHLLSSPVLNRTYRIRFLADNRADEFVERLSRLPFVEYAERIPRIYTEKIRLTPNDPRYVDQWHLAKINAAQAWDIGRGSAGIVFAAIDDAVLINHEDLKPNVWVNPGEIAGNGVDDDGNGFIDDVNGWDFGGNDNDPNPSSASYEHGTHVTGCAAAVLDNGIGVASPGGGIRIMGLKTGNSPGVVSFYLKAMQYAIAMGANVINMSWGSSSPISTTLENLINTGYQQGIIFTSSAGNSNSSGPHYPSDYANVLSVGSTNPDDSKSSFSNYGAGIDVMAPGSGILSTGPGVTQYKSIDGTSHSAPLVAGLCAQMRSLNPSLTPDQIINCLKSSCDDISAQNPSYSGKLGAGRINAYKAMQCVQGTVSTPPQGDIADAAGITVYPNPTGGSLKLKVQSQKPGDFGLSTFDLRLYDIYGRVVMTLPIPGSRPPTIDISHLPDGVYLLVIGNSSGSTVRRVVKH